MQLYEVLLNVSSAAFSLLMTLPYEKAKIETRKVKIYRIKKFKIIVKLMY